MAKPGRHRRGGRVTPKGTRPHSYEPGPVFGTPPSDEPDLLGGVRRRLSTGNPLDLLAEVSVLLNALDPRAADPFERTRGPREPGPNVDEVTRSFADVDLVETSALLAGIAHLAGDELVRARARRALDARHHQLPPWLADLGQTTPYRSVEMVHVLRDGDNVFVGARLPAGHELTFVVYIDHNLGTVVKDAFVVPEAIEQLIELLRSKNEDPDVSWHDLPLAEARARIAGAVDSGAMTVPRFETDTWPACRPMVEWINRLLPPGGLGYVRPEWDEDATADLAHRFFESGHGSDLDDADHRQLLESILWFGTDYGPGDPLRWSPTSVEILLVDWIPRKIVADARFLSAAPELLRAYIGYCHSERRIRRELTDETLDAVDALEPEYQRIIRSPRPQGPAAILAALGFDDPDDAEHTGYLEDVEDFDYESIALGWLSDAVGGEDALGALDAVRLPAEDFAWTGVPEDIRHRVGEVLSLCDRCCDELLDIEYRTACRRFLVRVATGDPNVFRRKGRADTAAAALCWIVGKANDLFTPLQGVLVKDLLGHFGLARGSVSQRAETLLRAAGIDRSERYGGIDLGSPDLLVSSRRRTIMERRDLLLRTPPR